ncbi:hypothetical protein M413DRAFT_449378 [Hebeloma cylindrosporum]|uniref:Thioesterase domain-containing protein n=1 Tax=Hebeloma cylindrosporum TaxID=76867 RepID=A0A0C2Y4S1_HEBCY|nr:hypothetical protein M413DRAFT_449378 [Hebeloma cylindrosporum h7]
MPRAAMSDEEAYTSMAGGPSPPEVLSHITGNAPVWLKEAAVRWYLRLGVLGDTGYGWRMRRRIAIHEVSLEPDLDDPEKLSAKTVTEIEVTPDMCNAQGGLSQGCMSCLIDEGSAISLLLMKLWHGGVDEIGVSQTLNLFFHQVVPRPGDKIKIINRSVATGVDVGCCKSEIWDVKSHKLVVSGAQIQMAPTVKPTRSNL